MPSGPTMRLPLRKSPWTTTCSAGGGRCAVEPAQPELERRARRRRTTGSRRASSLEHVGMLEPGHLVDAGSSGCARGSRRTARPAAAARRRSASSRRIRARERLALDALHDDVRRVERRRVVAVGDDLRARARRRAAAARDRARLDAPSRRAAPRSPGGSRRRISGSHGRRRRRRRRTTRSRGSRPPVSRCRSRIVDRRVAERVGDERAGAGRPGRWTRPRPTQRGVPENSSWRDLAQLDLVRALGDPVAAVVAVDVLERHVPRVAHAAAGLHRAVGGVAGEPVGAVVGHRDEVGDLHVVRWRRARRRSRAPARGRARLGPQLGERELDPLVAPQRLVPGGALACA